MVLGFTLGLAPLSAFAGSPTMTVQGRILKPDGTVFNSPSVDFKIRIVTPTNGCILYEETQSSKDLSASNGLFAVMLNDGTGTVNAPTTYNLRQALSNSGQFDVNSTYCGSGSGTVSWVPTDTSERKIIVYFKDHSSSTWEVMPTAHLSHTAYAVEASQVAGFTANNLLRVADSGVPQSIAALTSANFTELQALVGGTSTQYLKSSATTGLGIPVVAGSPASPSQGSFWYDSTSNTVKYYTGSTARSVITSNQFNTSAGCTADQTLTYNSATDTFTCAAIGIAASQISSGTISSSVLPTSATAWADQGSGKISYAGGNVGIGTTSPAAALDILNTTEPLRLKYDASNYTSFKVSSAGNLTVNVPSAASFGTVANTASTLNIVRNNAVVGGMATSNGVFSLYGGTTAANHMTIDTSGNVGIVTTSPQARLDVQSGGGNASIYVGGDTGAMTRTDSTAKFARIAMPHFLSAQPGVSLINGYASSTNSNEVRVGGGTSTMNAATAVEFYTAANGTTPTGTERMRIDGSGNVGIGTASPLGQLHLTKSATGAVGPAIYLDNNADTANDATAIIHYDSASVGIPYRGALKWTTNAGGTPSFSIVSGAASSLAGLTTRFTLDNNGNVGIGTASPGTTLDINGAFSMRGMAAPSTAPAGQGRIYFDSTSNTFKVSQNAGAYANLATTGGVAGGQSSTSALTFNTDADGAGSDGGVNFQSNGTNVVTVANSGEVSIATNGSNAAPDLNISASTSSATFGWYPSMNLANTNGSQGNGTSTYNRSAFQIGAGNGSVKGDLLAVYESSGFGNSVNLRTTTNHPLAFHTNSVERMRIDGSGNVGIGTTSPSAGLHLVNSSGVTAMFSDHAATNWNELQVNSGTTDQTKAKVQANGNANTVNFGSRTSSNLNLVTGDTARVTVDTSGNVGIGTTSPAGALHVNGMTAIFEGAANSASDAIMVLRKARGTNASPLIVQDGDYLNTVSFRPYDGTSYRETAQVLAKVNGTVVSGSSVPTDLVLSTGTTGASERMRITSAGKVGIGTSAPTTTLQVYGAIASKPAVSNGTSTVDFSAGNQQYTTSSCGAFQLNNLKDGGSYAFAVQGATAGTCSFTAYSDAGTTALTVHMPPNHGVTTASTHTLYNFMVMGTHVYVAWTPGY